MARKLRLLRHSALAVGLCAIFSATAAAPALPAIGGCPATLDDLFDFTKKLELQSKTPDLESHDSKNFYVTESVKVLGTQPLEFRVDLIRGVVKGLNVKLEGPFAKYAAALQRAHGKDMRCDAERCRWIGTNVAERGDLRYVEVTQYLGGYDSNLGCGYVH